MTGKPYSLAVRALIRNPQGHCLLIRRSSACKRFVGQWEMPGGKVDPGEAFDVALRREVMEETGLSIEPVGVVGAFGFEMEKVRVATLCMEARLADPRSDCALSTEHDRWAWVSVCELPQWDLTDGWRDLAADYAAREPSRGD